MRTSGMVVADLMRSLSLTCASNTSSSTRSPAKQTTWAGGVGDHWRRFRDRWEGVGKARHCTSPVYDETGLQRRARGRLPTLATTDPDARRARHLRVPPFGFPGEGDNWRPTLLPNGNNPLGRTSAPARGGEAERVHRESRFVGGDSWAARAGSTKGCEPGGGAYPAERVGAPTARRPPEPRARHGRWRDAGDLDAAHNRRRAGLLRQATPPAGPAGLSCAPRSPGWPYIPQCPVVVGTNPPGQAHRGSRGRASRRRPRRDGGGGLQEPGGRCSGRGRRPSEGRRSGGREWRRGDGGCRCRRLGRGDARGPHRGERYAPAAAPLPAIVPPPCSCW